MSYKIISFYAEPDPTSDYYTKCSKRFIASAAKHNVKPYVEKLKGEGDYFKNTRMKPRFILDQMLKFKESVMWVDVDSIIIGSKLSVPDSIDIGAVKKASKPFRPRRVKESSRDSPPPPRRPLPLHPPPRRPLPLHPSRRGKDGRRSLRSRPDLDASMYPFYAHCLYFKYSEQVVDLLQRWVDACEAATEGKVGDHSIFIEIVESQTVLNVSFIESSFATVELAPKSEVPSKGRGWGLSE